MRSTPPRSCRTLSLVERLSARSGGRGDPWSCRFGCRIPLNGLSWMNAGPPQMEVLEWMEDPYTRALLVWMCSVGGRPGPWLALLPRNGSPYARVCATVPIGSLGTRGKTGCLGCTGRPSQVLSLNPASGALQGRSLWFPSFSWD